MSEKGTVLVVDDSLVAREGLRALLDLQGWSVAEAGDGREAASYIEDNPAPSLILLDLIMPVLDGWGFLEWRKGNERAREIPVVVLSGATRAEDTVRLLPGVGGVRVLSKPVDPAALLSIVELPPRVEPAPKRPPAPSGEVKGVLKSVVETLQDYAIVVLDREGRIASWNATAERLTGHAARDVVGQPLSLLDAPGSRDLRQTEDALRAAAERERFAGEGWRVRKDGSRFWAHLVVTPLRDAAGALTGYGVVLGDVTARKRSEEDFERLFDLSQDMLCTAGFDGRFKRVNAAWTRCLGWSTAELLERPYLDFVHEEDRARTEREASSLAAGVTTVSFENRYRAKDGTYRWIQWNATPLREQDLVYAVARDVTSARKIDEQLRQAQKMDAVGRLAGGVAHDFNNVLMAVAGYSELVLDRMSPLDPSREHVEEIRRAGVRAGQLTRQLLTFSRRQVLNSKILATNDAITGLLLMLRRLIPESVSIVTRLDSGAGNVRADAGQLEQVILNLAINARDAMPRGGTLTFETRAEKLDAEGAKLRGTIQEGSYSVIAVTDTGHGMSEETLEHIFEPFFSTKGDRGTGLGLATVFGVVKQSGGEVFVRSEVGHGTTFEVWLPRVEEDAQRTTPTGTTRERPSGAGELVLVAEDDPAIRMLVTKVLADDLYDVATIERPEDAIRAVAERGRSPDLLVTDVVMPAMSGRALADALRARFPSLAVIFTSGYTDDAVEQHAAIGPGDVFVQKPFAPAALLKRVRAVLDARVR